jgi:hypothetical protein
MLRWWGVGGGSFVRFRSKYMPPPLPRNNNKKEAKVKELDSTLHVQSFPKRAPISPVGIYLPSNYANRCRQELAASPARLPCDL